MKEIFFALILACPVSAQIRALTPGPQIASTQDAWSLFTNPAGLAFINGAELVGGYTHHWANPTGLDQGAFSAGFGLLENFSLGLGLDMSQNFLNGQLGLAYKIGRSFSMGLLTSKSSGPFLFGLGFQYYPASWLSLGLTGKQVYSNLKSAPELQAGLSLRPFGNNFTIFGETRFWPNTNQLSDGYQIDPIAGLRLDLEGFALMGHVVIQKTPLFMFGIDINFDHFGLGGLGGNDYAGGRFKLTSEAMSSIAPDTQKWARVKLNSDATLETKTTSLLDSLFKKPVSPLFFLDSLDKLIEDPTIEGLFVSFDNLNFNFGRAEELRNSFLAFKNSGKQVVVYLNNPNPTDYYVATAATKIYLNPSGQLSLDRFRKTLVYLKKGLDELGVEAEVISAGSYKSAPRPLIANAPNAEELEVTNAILDEQYSHFIEAIAQKTQKSPIEIKNQINLGMLTAPEALAHGLVDALTPPDKIPELKNHAFAYSDLKKRIKTWGDLDQIAIIPISGTIIAGHSKPSFFFPSHRTGADDTIDSLEKASSNPRVKGIVLRIDSPGGDSFGSDQIYRAVLKARAQKPVIASMADVAASGGYYAAAGAHEIWAEPSTLTGSIGVFSLRFSAQKLFSKLGISSFELKKGELPGPTFFRPLSPAERIRGQQLVDWNYAMFKQAVATGQNLPLEDVSKLAEGRVWTGKQAYANKLVQNLGGFPQALAQVKSMAGIASHKEIALSLYQASNGYSFTLNPLSGLQDFAENQGHSLALMPYFL